VNRAAAGQSTFDRLFARLVDSIRSVVPNKTVYDVLAFVIPATSFVQIQLIGRLIVSELLALALLPWLLRARDRLYAPRWLLVLWAAWFVSQIVTDVIVGSEFRDWARGWAAITFTLVNLLAILTLVRTARRVRIFAVGLATGAVLGALIAPSTYVVVDPWKFAFGGAIGLAIAAAVSGSWAARRPWIAIVAFASFGLVNALLLFRAMSGVALLTSLYLAFTMISIRLPALERLPRAKPAVGIAFYAAAALVVYVTLNAATSANLFGEAARVRNEAQSQGAPSVEPEPSASDQPAPSPSSAATGLNVPGPIVGGRAEFLASIQAILDSPIVGHGSWARDPKYAEIQRRVLLEMGVPGGNQPTDPDLIPTHSYLLGSWVWAGIAGGLFWLAITVLALRLLATLYTQRIALTPLMVFVVSWLLWNIAFSPYGNTERIYATFAIALCLLGLHLAGRPVESTVQTSGRLPSSPLMCS
jgi:hypothetical protein